MKQINPKILLIAGLISLLLVPCAAAVMTECSQSTYGSWVCGTDGNSYECGRELINNEWVFVWKLTNCQGNGCTMVDWYGFDISKVAVCNGQIVSEKPTGGGACTPGDMYVEDCILGEKNTMLYICSSGGLWVEYDRNSRCLNELYLKYIGIIIAIILIYFIFIRKPPYEQILKQGSKP